jgi:hypothetical protein
MLKELILITILTLSGFSAEYTQKVKIPSISFPMIMDKNFGVMQRNCQWCHSYGYMLNQGNQSRAFWNGVVIKMREVYKAPISTKDDEAITNYLFKHYGNGELK